MPLISVWAYTYDGVYLAATRTAIMRNTMIMSFLTFLILLYTDAGIWKHGALDRGRRIPRLPRPPAPPLLPTEYWSM